MDHNHFAIDYGLASNVHGRGNVREAFGPIEPVAGEDILASRVGLNLNAIAVVFDFVNPLITLGRFSFQGWRAGV